MIPLNDTEKFEGLNQMRTVGIGPVKNAAGQKPVALVRADFLEYAAKLAITEFASPVDRASVYVWVMDDRENCNWLAFSNRKDGQYPEDAVILAGRIDKAEDLVA